MFSNVCGLVKRVFCVVVCWHAATLASLVEPSLPINASDNNVRNVLKGISYAPVPTKTMGEAFPIDDFMSVSVGALWDDNGRGDLKVMQKLGANTIRLYGNDPHVDHQQFLQAADAHGLRVMVGMSNRPFADAPNACSKNGWDCYEQTKAQYAANLERGFLQEDRSYHGALSHVIIANEPDHKAPSMNEPRLFCKAIISALDGMLSAEKEAKVQGNLVKFAATFSFSICQACSNYTTFPGLGQMYDLRAAMLDPSTVSYKPKNDLREAYEQRFHHSFNAQSPAFAIEAEFLEIYSAEFREPFFIGEYHAPLVAQQSDLLAIMKLAEDPSNNFMGICFFEFQTSYWKGGSELAFGMLGLGDVALTTFNANGVPYIAWCLDNVPDPHQSGMTLVQAVTQAFGGEGYDFSEACLFDPAKVPVSKEGYQLILRQSNTARMMKFVERLVGHLGGVAIDDAGLMDFTSGYSGQAGPLAGDFDTMVGVLQETHPSWARWDDVSAACVVDQNTLPQALEEAVEYACATIPGILPTFNCSVVPPQCNGTVQTLADYLFSLYYDHVGFSDPLVNCFFGGSAQYAPRETYKKWDNSCVVTHDPKSTALTQEGYDAVLETKDADSVAQLIERVLKVRFHENIRDISGLADFASNKSANLPRSFEQLMVVLRNVPWTCDGDTHRQCSSDPQRAYAWLWLGLATSIGVISIVILYFVWDRRQRHRQSRPPLIPESSRSMQDVL